MIGYNKILSVILLISTICISSGCKKFLDITSQTSAVNPTAIKDFQEMLNSDSLATCKYFLLDVMSDDMQFTDAQAGNASSYFSRAYFYEQNIWINDEIDVLYNTSYSRIFQMNIILSRVESAPQDDSNTPANKSNVISQSLINRAFFYLQLVNTYGPAYDATTASTDLAVPLTLLPDNNALPSRSTVEQVYTQIISDLKRALDNTYLPAKGSDIIHPGKAAAYALLARAYLYREDYTNAALYADSTLALASTLQNYNNTGYTSPSQLLNLTSNPEILMGKITSDVDWYRLLGTGVRISSGLNRLLTTVGTVTITDQRYSKRTSWGLYPSSGTTYFFDNSVGVPEAMLIKAECLARAGSFADAGSLLDQLRSNRVTVPDVRTYTATNILNYVLNERRRELYFHGGLRLFDLKRLNKTEQYQTTITRTNVAGTTVLATVLPNSNRYLLPFSPNVIATNENIVQNPRN